MRRFRGRRTVMSLRLCSRAPWTMSSSAAMPGAVYRHERTFGSGAGGRRPRPLLGRRDEARADRIEEDVRRRGAEVVVSLDEPRRESVAEQMAAADVTRVEPLRVDTVQSLEPGRELRLRRLH